MGTTLPPPPEIPAGPTRSKLPFIVGGTGGALLIGSAILGLYAKSLDNTGLGEPPATGDPKIKSAKRDADIATGMLAVGVVGVAIGTYLWLRDRDHVTVAPTSDGHSMGVSIVGPF